MSADIGPGSAFFNSIFDAYHQNSDPLLLQTEKSILPLVFQQHLKLGARRIGTEVKVRVFTAALAEDGWEGRDSILHIVMPDMPFIVDSVVAAVERNTRGVLQVLHPVMKVERDQDGGIIAINSANGVAESWVEIVFRRLLLPRDAETLCQTIQELLEQVIFVNSAWNPIKQILGSVDLGNDLNGFRDWLLADNFTFMAIAKFRVGTAELDETHSIGLHELGIPPFNPRLMPGLHIMKSQIRSTVHRSVQIDEIHFVPKDKNQATLIVYGLFGLNAYASMVSAIPVVSEKMQHLVTHLQIRPNSHSYKDLLQFVNVFPRDVFFSANPEWLTRVAGSLLNRSKQMDTWVFATRSPNSYFADVVVFLPRDIVNTRLRLKIEAEIEKLYGALDVLSVVRLDENPTAVMHFQVRLGAASNLVSESNLLAAIKPLAIDWDRDFAEYVINQLGDDVAAHNLLQTFGRSFEPNYQNDHSVELGYADISKIMTSDDMYLEITPIAGENNYSVRIFHPDNPLGLTDLLPVLEAFGLPITAEFPYIFSTPGVRTWWLQELEFNLGKRLSDATIKELEVAIRLVIDGHVESDKLFSLITHFGLNHKSVITLMSLRNYVSQWLTNPVGTIETTMLAYPDLSVEIAKLVEHQLLNRQIDSAAAERIEARITEVPSLEQDQILRALLAAARAIVRTNLHSDIDFSTAAVAFKFKSEQIAQLPDPKPFAEVWVESARVRGVHIRFGAVARGGLRWSDRYDDIRTEVLGLVRAQNVKNSVIVPAGAKGGFYPKQLKAEMDRNLATDTAVSAYQEFINALLDITDNLVSGEVVLSPAPALDTADPYLVVAADKGTASFSDYANEISTSRGYWLGDAFASGGSNGYDHKGMGITARGAFESVKHHFALLGIDPTVDAITVVGIGDMSGDVFGNGMLLSRTLKLIAAFDHRHIFIDPNPNPETTWAERERLFNLPRSSWADFNPEHISSGGGIFPRTAKSIRLTDEIKAVLDVTAEVLTPNELINAILKAPVDLLWNGGIGTYIKASGETHLQVGDKANDAIRIDASQLRVRVVGEGGNLGVTQAGRVEAALNGVAINSDAIDNSAGVDTSDHEVNLKILLNSIDDQIERNQILQQLTPEVANLVLADNIAQNSVLTQAANRSEGMASVHARMLDNWEQRGLINLELEKMPSPAELQTRANSGKGLTKPELSVMLAHVKLELKDLILQSDIPVLSWSEKFLFSYFPADLHTKFESEIRNHPLRSEIISTVIANQLVNRVGITAIWRVSEEMVCDVLDVIKAYLFTFESTDLDSIHNRITQVDWSQENSRILLTKEVRRFQDRVVRWLLSNRAMGHDFFSEIFETRTAFSEIRHVVHTGLKGDERVRWQRQTAEYTEAGVEADLAAGVAGLLDEYAALDLLNLKLAEPIATSSERYFEISNSLAGDRILNLISALPRTDIWQTKARAALRADMYGILANVTAFCIQSKLSITDWQELHAVEIHKIQSLVTEIEQLSVVDIAALSVVLRNLRNFANQIGSSQSTS
ncbi:MAG: hypothetical protein RL038_330 [Actinomycetota bacterium]